MKEKIITAKIKLYRWDELSDQDKRVINDAKIAAQSAYAPYSGFQVGVALVLKSGKHITGSNQENGAYTAGMCAERTALNYATALYPDDPVETLALVAYDHRVLTPTPCTPCGECRQVMKEVEMRFSHPIRILMAGDTEVWECCGIETLLPLSFTL